MAKQMINFVNDDGSEVAIETTPDVPRLRKMPGRVSQSDLDIIRRAIGRYITNTTCLDAETDELTGRTIAAICRVWLRAQAEDQALIAAAPALLAACEGILHHIDDVLDDDDLMQRRAALVAAIALAKGES